MRSGLLLGVAAFTLAACGGGSGAGPETVGTVAPVAGGGSVYDQFLTPTEARTYAGVGGVQHYEYQTDSRECCGQQAEVYGGTATTVRGSTVSVAYDPRDAIFTLKIQDQNSGISSETRFQDPASRTDFGGSVQPQWGTPDMSDAPANATGNFRYLQAGEGNPLSPYLISGSGFIDYNSPTEAPDGTDGTSYQATTFFYEKPGSSTKYVTLAGYLNNRLSYSDTDIEGETERVNYWKLDRGAFAYGIITDNGAVPTSGTATFTGNMLGTMIYNPTLDEANPLPNYFQWLSGTSRVEVNFGTKAVTLGLEGAVFAPQIDRFNNSTATAIPTGSTFRASGSATIDLVGKGGFTGSFANGSFVFTRPDTTTAAVNIAGSSIDGAFYGPKAEEVGGGFRVVGGTPDERIDILGAFTGKK